MKKRKRAYKYIVQHNYSVLKELYGSDWNLRWDEKSGKGHPVIVKHRSCKRIVWFKNSWVAQEVIAKHAARRSVKRTARTADEVLQCFMIDRPTTIRTGWYGGKNHAVTVDSNGTHYYYKGRLIASKRDGELTLTTSKASYDWTHQVIAKIMREHDVDTHFCVPSNEGWGPTKEPYPLKVDLKTKKIINPIPVDKYVKSLLRAQSEYSIEYWMSLCDDLGILTEELKAKVDAKLIARKMAA